MRFYTLYMIDTYGRDLVDEMMSNKRTVARIKTYQIEEMIDEYKQKTKDLALKLNQKI